MKTIGYRERVKCLKIIHCYFKTGQTRHERINEALKELRHMGNINVYLIKGNKVRYLFSKGM